MPRIEQQEGASEGIRQASALRRSSADRSQPAGRRPPRCGGALAAAGRPRRARRAEQRQPGRRRGARGDPQRSAPRSKSRLRAAAARAVAALPLPLGLLEYFASDSLAVSAPVLAAATLDPSQWRRCMPPRTRKRARFIETLHPEVAAPSRDAEAGRAMRSAAGLTATSVPQQSAEPALPSSLHAAPSLHRCRRADRTAPPHARRRSRAGVADARSGRSHRRCSAGNAGRAAKLPGSRAHRAER